MTGERMTAERIAPRPVSRQRAALVRSAWGLGLVVASSLVLTACSSSTSAIPPSATTTTTSQVTTTSTTVPASTTTTSAEPTCPSADLALAADTSRGTSGAGSTYVAYTLTYRGASPCMLDGFPAVNFTGSLAPGGAPAALTIEAAHSGGPPTSVSLASGQSAGFYLVVGNVPVDGVGCVSVTSIAVTPPGGTRSLTLTTALSPCGPSVGVTPVESLSQLSS